MDLDDAFNKAGMTKYQIYLLFMICLVRPTCFLTNNTGTFLSATPSHRCRTPFDTQEDVNISQEAVANLTFEKCQMYNYNYSNCKDVECLYEQGDVAKVSCEDGWVFESPYFEETTTSEWGLVCNRRTLDSMANSIFFFGLFVGSLISGEVTNRFGRSKTLAFFSLIVGLGNVGTSLSPWFSMYLVFRFVTAMANIYTVLVGFALIQELTPTSRRTFTSTLETIIVGWIVLLFPLVAYLQRDWRGYMLTIGILGTSGALIFGLLVPESPREDDAKRIINRIYKSANKRLTDKDWSEIVESEKEKVRKSKEAQGRLTYVDLFRLPMTRFVTINVMFGWFVVSMVFYGLLLNITSFAGSPYLNTTINLLMARVGDFLYYATKYLGRKRSTSMSFIIAGICCILSMLMVIYSNGTDMNNAAVAFAVIGRLFSGIAFSLVYIVTAEAYPTSLRGPALGMASMSARIGGILTPFTLQLQQDIPWLTQTVFGILSIAAGLSALTYPETIKQDMLTTIHESEEMYLNQLPKTRKLLRIKMPDGNPEVLANENFVENKI